MNDQNDPTRKSLGPESSGTVVDAWLERAEGLDSAKRFDLFERAFVAVWERARVPLGGITLVAGLDRVLVNARDRYPALKTVTVDASGIQFAGLRKGAHLLSEEELLGMIRFLLVEFFRLLGSLTGDLITPALHATLRGVDLGTESEASHPGETKGNPRAIDDH